MKIRYTLAAALAAAAVACTNPVDTEAPETPTSITLPPVPAALTSGTVAVGNAVTVSDQGWKSSFGGTITVETDATVIYAVVFSGTGGAAPVSGVTVGSQALTKVGMVGNDMSLDPGIGTCGKDGQGVPVGVGQPTLRIDALTVGGTATG